jgi:hypothetical protein
LKPEIKVCQSETTKLRGLGAMIGHRRCLSMALRDEVDMAYIFEDDVRLKLPYETVNGTTVPRDPGLTRTHQGWVLGFHFFGWIGLNGVSLSYSLAYLIN